MEYSEKVKELISKFEELSIEELDDLIEVAQDKREEKFDDAYEIVEVFPGSRIEEKIKKETGFHCYHKPCESYSSGRGTHVIVIPKKDYCENLKQALIRAYDEL